MSIYSISRRDVIKSVSTFKFFYVTKKYKNIQPFTYSDYFLIFIIKFIFKIIKIFVDISSIDTLLYVNIYFHIDNRNEKSRK